jgi:hypothetical protein
MAICFLLKRTEEGGLTRQPADRGVGVLAGAPGYGGDLEMGENGEEGERVLFPSSPWLRWSVVAAPCERAATGVLPRRWLGAAALGSSGVGGKWLWRCGMRRGAASSIYRRGKGGGAAGPSKRSSCGRRQWRFGSTGKARP